MATGFLRNSMINEEGGIDPEQFRMEAMFDRMDAIGKSMLGLTIQCAQCHNHKFDPLTQEEYYRMFAFLNDAHEANIAVYTPDEQMQRRRVLRQIARNRSGLASTARPTGASEWPAGRRRSSDDQPDWTVVRPDVDTSGGRNICSLDDGSFLAAGLRPDEAHGARSRVKTDLRQITRLPARAAERPELAVGGPGPIDLGHGALTEFRSRPRRPASRRRRRSQDRQRPRPTSIRRRRRFERIFDDRTEQARASRARSRSPSTARTTRPGASTSARAGAISRARRCSSPRSRSRTPAGTMLTFSLVQNHGGWNSDDNQNNNLGRFRFSVTTAADAAGRSAAGAACARSGRSGRPSARRPRSTRRSATGARRCPSGRTRTSGSKSCGRRIPPAHRSWCCCRASEPRETHLLKRGDFLKPDRVVDAGRAGVPAPARRAMHADAAVVRALAGRPRFADHGRARW